MQITYQTKDLHPEDLENSQNLTIKQFFKWAKDASPKNIDDKQAL